MRERGYWSTHGGRAGGRGGPSRCASSYTSIAALCLPSRYSDRPTYSQIRGAGARGDGPDCALHRATTRERAVGSGRRMARSAGEMERAKDDRQRAAARRGSPRGRQCGASEDGAPWGMGCATCNVLVSIAPGLVFRHLRVLTGMARD